MKLAKLKVRMKRKDDQVVHILVRADDWDEKAPDEVISVYLNRSGVIEVGVDEEGVRVIKMKKSQKKKKGYKAQWTKRL